MQFTAWPHNTSMHIHSMSYAYAVLYVCDTGVLF